ncbi:MAG: peptide ABC transporter substrate-binding protein [Fimbriimonas sp.]
MPPGYIHEPDWKLLRSLSPVALERLSQRILDELVAIANDSSMTAHDRYGTIYGHIHDRNKDMAYAFDGLRRSTAINQLALMKIHGLITDEEYAGFSTQTRGILDAR